jgi:hypothetical protein
VSFVYNWSQLSKADSFFGIRALIVTGAAEYCPFPGIAGEFVDDCQSHSTVFLANTLQTARRTDIHALHTEITGDLFYLNKRRPSMETTANVQHLYGMVGTNFNASAAANTFSRENFFGNSTGRP